VFVLDLGECSNFSNEHNYLNNSNFGFVTFPSIGLFYKENLSNANERLFFQYEGTYSHMNLATSNSYIEPVNNLTVLNDITLKLNSFNNLAFLKYEFPKGKIKPSFQIGGFAKYFFKTEYNRKHEQKFSWGDTYFTDQMSDSPFSKIDVGINCGIGLKSNYMKDKEVFLDFRYQKGFGLIKGFNTNTFSINLGFQIGK